jgi:hypothetical protein
MIDFGDWPRWGRQVGPNGGDPGRQLDDRSGARVDCPDVWSCPGASV